MRLLEGKSANSKKQGKYFGWAMAMLHTTLEKPKVLTIILFHTSSHRRVPPKTQDAPMQASVAVVYKPAPEGYL